MQFFQTEWNHDKIFLTKFSFEKRFNTFQCKMGKRVLQGFRSKKMASHVCTLKLR